MNKETIDKEFDDELEKILPKEQWGIFRYEWVKQFIHQQIEKAINEERKQIGKSLEKMVIERGDEREVTINEIYNCALRMQIPRDGL